MLEEGKLVGPVGLVWQQAVVGELLRLWLLEIPDADIRLAAKAFEFNHVEQFFAGLSPIEWRLRETTEEWYLDFLERLRS